VSFIENAPYVVFFGVVAFFAAKLVFRRRLANGMRVELFSFGVAFVAALIAAGSHIPAQESALVAGPTSTILDASRDTSRLCDRMQTVLAGPAVGSLESVTSLSGANVPSGSVVPRAMILRVSGWGFDKGSPRAARGVCILIDGRPSPRATVRFGFARRDVATNMHTDQALASGYVATLPLTAIASGTHLVGVAVISGDGTLRELTASRSIVVP